MSLTENACKPMLEDHLRNLFAMVPPRQSSCWQSLAVSDDRQGLVLQNLDEMDGAKFSKLCRDCKLLNRSFTTTDVDLIFAKTKAKVPTWLHGIFRNESEYVQLESLVASLHLPSKQACVSQSQQGLGIDQ